MLLQKSVNVNALHNLVVGQFKMQDKHLCSTNVCDSLAVYLTILIATLPMLLWRWEYYISVSRLINRSREC